METHEEERKDEARKASCTPKEEDLHSEVCSFNPVDSRGRRIDQVGGGCSSETKGKGSACRGSGKGEEMEANEPYPIPKFQAQFEATDMDIALALMARGKISEVRVQAEKQRKKKRIRNKTRRDPSKSVREIELTDWAPCRSKCSYVDANESNENSLSWQVDSSLEKGKSRA